MGENGMNGDYGAGEDSGTEEGSLLVAEVTLPAEMSSVPEFLEFLASVERQEGFSDERIEEVQAALREALTNTVENAAKTQAGDITVICKHDPWGKFMIIIRDKGEPFNILLADIVFFGEDSPVDATRRDSARLIKRMIDNIEQKRAEDMNILTLTVSPNLRTKR